MNAKLSFTKSTKPKAVEEFLDFYFYRRVAMWFVPLFYKLKMTPNGVTWLSLVSGIFAAFLVYHAYPIAGFFVFLFSIFFDCADGQLARLTGKSSPTGRILDGISDLLCVIALWCAIYFGNYFEVEMRLQAFWGMGFAGISMILHCWRYDNVKIRSLELVEANYKETDLDVAEALALAKKEWQALHIFEAFLALTIAWQMYFFVRGKEQKKTIALTDGERRDIAEILEPHMRHWSWLGVGHHNTLVLLGLLFVPITTWGLWFAFFMIAVPMNLWFLIGEVRFNKAYLLVQKKLPV